MRLLTRRADWTGQQASFLHAATRYHATRSMIVGASVLSLALAGLQLYGWLRAAELHDRLLVARTADVPAVLAEMGPYRRWLDPMLRRESPRGASQKDRSRRLRLALALLPHDQQQVPALVELMLTADPEELTLIRDALRPFASRLTADLWGLLSDPAVARSRRLRAAGALADYDPTNPGWRAIAPDLTATLSADGPLAVAGWIDVLVNVRKAMVPALRMAFEDGERSAQERSVAAGALAVYLSDDLDSLFPLVLAADAQQSRAFLAPCAAVPTRSKSVAPRCLPLRCRRAPPIGPRGSPTRVGGRRRPRSSSASGGAHPRGPCSRAAPADRCANTSWTGSNPPGLIRWRS